MRFHAAARSKLCLSIYARLAACAGVFLVAVVPARPSALQGIPGSPLPPPAATREQNPGQTPQVVDGIVFDGNRKYPQQTLQTRIFTRVGDTYSENSVRQDFMALWNTQYFDEITLETQESTTKPNALIVIFHVKERPTISVIDYRNIKSVTKSDILDRFKERKLGLSVESQLDPTKVRRAEVIVQELLSEHGRQFAIVRGGIETIPATNRVRLIFDVDEGPKVKVGDIKFMGNTVFSDRRIIRSMRMSKPYAIPMWLFDVPMFAKTFDRSKLDQDLEIGIRGLYQNDGYFKADIKDPILTPVQKDRAGVPLLPLPLIGRQKGRFTNITIPIDEGQQYRMGRLVIRSVDPEKGLSVQRTYLESIFPLKQGMVFDVSKIRKSIEDYTKLYGTQGFIDFTATPSTDVHDDSHTVDLTFDFDEQKQFFVRRIDFAGNLTTRDRVIRRELLVGEGDIFNNRAWELSLLRLNQLNYFEEVKPTNAELKRNIQQSSVDILLTVKEKGRQSISLNGGVSGLAGSFVGLSYQTNNFLGLGETLTLSTSYGTYQKSAVFGFTEPYLFDRPISTGFTVSTSRYNFDQARQYSLLLGQQVQIDPNIVQNYNQNTTGGTIFASYPLRRFSFSRIGVTYGYSVTSITAFSQASTLLFETLKFQSLAGPSALDGINSSKIIPTFTYNTVNNPINPTGGKSLYAGFTFEGLGGNVRTYSPVIEAKYFRPNYHRHNVIALRLLAGYASGWGSRVLPPYSRWFLGGEQDLRGFDPRTVSPLTFVPVATTTALSYMDPTLLDANGSPQFRSVNVPTLAYRVTFPGGDTQAVLNAEYRIPIAGPVAIGLFNDLGTVGVLKRDQLALDPTNVSNLNSQFPGANLGAQLGVAENTNFHLRSSAGVELVVNLPIVQAPFRLYWSYNYRRVAEQVIAPPNVFNIPTSITRGLPLDTYQTQIVPQINALQANTSRINYFEALSTFRFTVSRTF